MKIIQNYKTLYIRKKDSNSLKLKEIKNKCHRITGSVSLRETENLISLN